MAGRPWRRNERWGNRWLLLTAIHLHVRLVLLCVVTLHLQRGRRSLLVQARLLMLKRCRAVGMVVLLVRRVSLLERLLLGLPLLLLLLLMLIALPKRASTMRGRLRAIVVCMVVCMVEAPLLLL